jgi:hypothetical protein
VGVSFNYNRTVINIVIDTLPILSITVKVNFCFVPSTNIKNYNFVSMEETNKRMRREGEVNDVEMINVGENQTTVEQKVYFAKLSDEEDRAHTREEAER